MPSDETSEDEPEISRESLCLASGTQLISFLTFSQELRVMDKTRFRRRRVQGFLWLKSQIFLFVVRMFEMRNQNGKKCFRHTQAPSEPVAATRSERNSRE